MSTGWIRAIVGGAVLLASILAPSTGRGERMNLLEFGQAEGLGNLALHALQQDPRGFLWIGTDNGLYRHDGQRIDRIATQELRRVFALSAAGENLWIVADSGAWLWRSGKLQHVLPRGVQLFADSPAALAARGDEAWFITTAGVQRVVVDPATGGWSADALLSPEQLARHPEMKQIVSVMVARDGAVWVGCDLAICRWRDGQLQRWDERAGVARQPWHALLQAADGSLWARSTEAVLALDEGAAAFVDRTAPGDRGDPMHRYPLIEDAAHRILTASQHGVLRWQDQHWRLFGKRQGLPGDGRVHALLSDREGGLWLGLNGTGLLQWRGYGRWESWTDEDGLPSSVVWSIQRARGHDGRLHVGTGRGLAVFEPGKGTFRSVPIAHRSDVMQVLPDGGDGIWAATDVATLHRFRGGREVPGAVAAPSGRADGFSRALTARDGALWVLTPTEIRRWPDHGRGEGQPVKPPPGGAEEAFADACEGSDGTLWFAGRHTLARMHAGRWLPPLAVEGGVEYLACGADGSVFAASESGRAWRVRDPHADMPSLDALESPVLKGRLIVALLRDSRGWLWIGTDAGLVVHDGTRWKLVDRSQGLIWNDTSGSALYEDRDRSLWVGTSRGVSRLIDPAAVFASPMPRPLLLSATRGTDRRLVRDGETLAWTRDRIHLRLASLQFADRALQLEYRIAGRDDGWSVAKNADIELAELAPGPFQVEVRLVDPDTGRHSESITFGFTLRPPWWQTAWAMTLGVVALLGTAFGWYRWRRRQWRERQTRLERLVSERTRDLEASRAQLEELASRDALTGLWNRRALTEILRREIVRARREGQPLTVAIIDIDHFKRVNDTHGHPAGDAVLKTFAGRLAGTVRPYDAVGRLGGEEFVLVLPGLDLNEPQDRERLCRMQREVSAEPTAIGRVTSSFGAAMLSEAACDDERLLEAADRALYRAKHGGRDQVAFDDAVPA
ncbi:diguanylate cyclase [Mitsuaria sp. GD03876]|uniref:ligand-binding sensor domain-containing diguanylate cyclase n=1 Tax=Mitsuaria sp. GD03876 TaxID=2975399 RepID=UPI0024485C03|nr:diguanylate cyclase [Mitsuaria sp. GD03876]MDH0865935.1 diguanylate cyclase [Mitsuaria sp. GD03876]